MPPADSHPVWTTSRLVAVMTTLAAAALFVIPAPEGVPAAAFRGFGISLFAVGLYATAAVPEFLTAIAFFTLAMIFHVAPAPAVFSGFHSTALWLVFGGLVLGVAVEKTGLGARIATAITGRLGGSYPKLVAGLALVGIALAFVMPSTMGRVVLLMPIVIAMADALGYKADAPERSGLALAAACGTWMPSTAILPANVPNMVLIGVSENLFDVHFTYGSYMLLHMPFNGIGKMILIIVLVLVLFPGASKDSPPTSAAAAPLNADAKRLSIVLAVTLGLWMTDFLHHISPAWIALAAAVACLSPGIALVDQKDFKTKVNFPSVIYIGGILSLGTVLVETGAGQLMGEWMLRLLPLDPAAPFTSFLSLIGLGMAVNMASTAPSVPAVVGPLAADLAAASGIPLKTVLMTQVIGYSTVLLPYQVPPVIVAMQLAGVRFKDGAKMTLSLAAVSIAVLVPLNYLWWSWLGAL
ncbi:MAG: SLC13 family permease [Proteobacteria bacterium]|nr:SLC13 family permease [Pseudomonadota bacterium]